MARAAVNGAEVSYETARARLATRSRTRQEHSASEPSAGSSWTSR
jgi:hypothetical protein